MKTYLRVLFQSLGKWITANRNSLIQLLFSGLAFGAVGLYYGYKQDQKIDLVVSSVSTRYLNETFPDYLEAVTKLISKTDANDEIWILIDHVGHGHYSGPDLYKNYVDAIKNTSATSVHILIYGEDAARDALQSQFKKDEQGGLELTGHPYARNFSNYFKYYHITKQTDYWKFLNILIEQQDKFCQQLTAFPNKIEIRTLSQPSSREALWLWMVVRKGSKEAHEMIFASPSYADEEDKGLAFKTSDSNLLHVFSSRFNDKWVGANPLPGPDAPRPCFGKSLFPPPGTSADNQENIRP